MALPMLINEFSHCNNTPINDNKLLNVYKIKSKCVAMSHIGDMVVGIYFMLTDTRLMQSVSPNLHFQKIFGHLFSVEYFVFSIFHVNVYTLKNMNSSLQCDTHVF